MSEDLPTFRSSTIKALLEQSIAENSGEQKMDLSNEVVDLVAEYLRCVVIEATQRSAAVAGDEGTIDETHLEKILPQLLLDIS